MKSARAQLDHRTAGDASLFRDIAGRAAAADRGETDLGADMRQLFASGLLARLCATASGPGVQQAVALFRGLGAANLAVGRLAEGHVNALRLIELYGDARQIDAAGQAAAAGELFGVWGAEGATPVQFRRQDGAGGVLVGEKRFCSGLGLVRQAIVTARSGEGVQLVLIRCDDPARQDAGCWQTTGMRATISGGFRMAGLRGEPVGQPDDYMREPHFEGGIWRYAALQTGALERLAEALGAHVQRAGAPSPMQAARLVTLTRLARTARLWVEHAAGAVENSADPDISAALLAREAVEDACLRGMVVAERGLGTAAFMAANPVERILRDLAFFLRQANLDGKTMLAAGLILRRGRADDD